MQFWTEWFANKKTNSTSLIPACIIFIADGFGSTKIKNVKDGYIYVKKDGNNVKVLRPDQIQNYVLWLLQERQMSPDLRDYVYNSPKVGKFYV
jgi:hypothetical protein